MNKQFFYSSIAILFILLVLPLSSDAKQILSIVFDAGLHGKIEPCG